MGLLKGTSSTDSVNEGSAASLKCRFKRNSTLTTPVCGVNYRIDDLTEDREVRGWTTYTDPITGSDILIRLTSHDNVLYNTNNKSELRAVTLSGSFGDDDFATCVFKYNAIDMEGPLNTDNIRALDGTLAATIDDATGKVNFVGDVDVAGAFDVQSSARVFQNLEVQGPLASFLQSISVGGFAGITGSLAVGVDVDIGHDLDVQNDVLVNRWLTVLDRTSTVNLRMTGHGPATGKILTAVDGVGNVTWGSGGDAGIASVPTGESILFYSNAQVLGYTLETLIADDDVVYITKGTAAGGQAGGASKPGSTWTKPYHGHLTRDHTLTIPEMPAHVHGCSPDNTSGGGGDREAGAGNSALTTSTGGSLPHNHDATHSGRTPLSYRPRGHNFTLQTRN